MKRSWELCVLLSVLLLCVMSNFGFAQTKTLTIKFSSPFVATDSRTMTYQYWGDMVSKETNGRVKVTIFPGASLIPLRDHYTAISTGSVGGGLLISSFLDSVIPELVVTSVTGTIPVSSPEDVINVEKAIKPILTKILEKHNIKYLFATYEGELAFIVRKAKNPILKMDDLRGLIIRDAGKYSSVFLRKAGMSTVTLDTGQIVPALSYGTIDAVFFNWTTAVALKAAEVAPSMTYLGTYGTWVFSGMNLDMFNSLSAEDQKVLLRAADKATEYSVQLGKKERDTFFANPGGFKIYRLPELEQQKFKMLVNEAKDEVLRDVAPSAKELQVALEKLAK